MNNSRRKATGTAIEQIEASDLRDKLRVSNRPVISAAQPDKAQGRWSAPYIQIVSRRATLSPWVPNTSTERRKAW